jgi:hypothetical protein
MSETKKNSIQFMPAKGQKIHFAQKSSKERLAIAVHKKNHHKLLREIFGTKRPTAGIVARHFLTSNN